MAEQTFLQRWSERVLRFLGGSHTLQIWVWSESEQNYTHNYVLFSRHFSETKDFKKLWCFLRGNTPWVVPFLQEVDVSENFKPSRILSSYWVCSLPAAQAPWSLCSGYGHTDPRWTLKFIQTAGLMLRDPESPVWNPETLSIMQYASKKTLQVIKQHFSVM